MTCTCRARKDEHHNHFMAVIEAAFSHWPEWEPFKPTSADALRYELMHRAGQVEEIELVGADAVTIDNVRAAAKFFAPGKPMKMFKTDTGIRLVKPKSIAGRPKKAELMAISGPVFSEIEKVIGFSVDRLLSEHQNAA